MKQRCRNRGAETEGKKWNVGAKTNKNTDSAQRDSMPEQPRQKRRGINKTFNQTPQLTHTQRSDRHEREETKQTDEGGSRGSTT